MAEEPKPFLVTVDPPSTAKVQLLPCNIDYDGKARVEEYFIEEPVEGQTYIRSHFRGRELLGSTISLPEGYKGIIGTKDSPTTIHVEKEFKEITSWNRETKPSTRDPINSWMQWTKISEAV